MQRLMFLSVITIACHVQAQNFLNFPPLPYHGNGFYEQANYHPPSFPTHYRPFAIQDRYQPVYKPIPFQAFYPNHYENSIPNPLRSHLHHQFIPDYPNVYQQFPQPPYDESYQDLDELNKVSAAFREPIQIIPSRFPPRVENFVERIQNHFSIYNPVPLVPVDPLLAPNGTSINTTNGGAANPSTTTADSEVVTTSSNAVSSTDSPGLEPVTEASEDTTNRQEEITTRKQEEQSESTSNVSNGDLSPTSTEEIAVESNTKIAESSL